MIRAVLDTNLIVSANVRPDGRQAQILYLALSGRFRMCVSEPILQEYEEVLRRPRFRFTEQKIHDTLAEIRKTALLVDPQERVSVAADKDDNKIIECAIAADAHYLVTGNLRDFPPRFRRVAVVSPLEFQSLLAVSLS